VIGAITAGLYAGGVPPVTNSYESIATVSLGSAQTTISFSSIPSTYKHLQIRFIARSTRVNAGDYMDIRFNSDSSSIYAKHDLIGDGVGTGATSQTSRAQMEFNRIAAANATSGVFAGAVIDILDYANTDKNKTARGLVAYDNNGEGQIHLNSGLWASTAAINAISFTCNNQWAANSQFALYGIKG
jgi:hypothetical protein